MAGVAAGVALTTGALLTATALPAQAYSPDPSPTVSLRDTDYCPCSLSDPFDGTRFAKQAGGEAVKIELRNSSGSYVAKTEFHPYGDKLWVYDTKNDGDSVYTEALWYDSSGYLEDRVYVPPGTDSVLDYSVESLNVPEGNTVWLYVWDDSGLSDLIVSTSGTA
jgi:hypothetical protein